MAEPPTSQPGSAAPTQLALPAQPAASSSAQRRPRDEGEPAPTSRRRAELSSTVSGDLQRDIAATTTRLNNFEARADHTQNLNNATLQKLTETTDNLSGRVDQHELALNDL